MVQVLHGRAAALAEIGVVLNARGRIPDGLMEMPATAELPAVGSVECVVQARREGMRDPAAQPQTARIFRDSRRNTLYTSARLTDQVLSHSTFRESSMNEF